jgi:lipopolysaccharide/colanic/teichoic acid biosynthesis glycosyltransferase
MTWPARGREYVEGRLKRGMDFAASLTALLVMSPVFLVLGMLVILTSGPPVLFAQERVGRKGRPFRLFKFRTMRPGAERGLPITAEGDSRVTRLGRLLRPTKLDELPQLWNVLRGDMSLVGPRPEVPRYVAAYTLEQRQVLEARPGLTDPATVFFVEEEAILGAVDPDRRESHYIHVILPRKLRMNLEYLEQACPVYDLLLVLKTLGIILHRRKE